MSTRGTSPDQQSAILDAITEGVFTVDADWRITSFNAAAERITGVTRATALGRPCREVFRASACDGHCAIAETMRRGRPVHCRRLEIVTTAGDRVPVSVSTNLLRDGAGTIIGGVETFRDLRHEEALRRAAKDKVEPADLVALSPAMRRVVEALPAIAESSATVLLLGESGSGKEVLARAIHRLSPRRSKPFVAVNCGALPDQLLESELFGYVAGAFTDAKRDKPGRFALAEGGSLLLDEIGELSQSMQVTLLRVLQERRYEPLGGTRSLKADVRVLAATNRDLAGEVAAGRFREDLYYRLAVVPMTLPPLRERREDLPILAERLLEEIAAREGRPMPILEADCLERLLAWPWPGNVRELANALERACILGRGRLLPEHLPGGGSVPVGAGSTGLAAASAEAETALIRAALAQHHGNRLAAAKALGIHRATLFRKLRRLGLRD